MKHLTHLAVLGAAFIFVSFGFAQETSFKAQLAKQEMLQSVHSQASSPTTSTSTPTNDVYSVNYFRNASAGTSGGSVVDVVDPGANAPANIYAAVYVLTPDEELQECCACQLTPDQVIEFNVNKNLVSNPASMTTHNGVIKIISSTSSDPGNPTPTPELRAWITHVANNGGTTEVEFSESTLSSGELSALSNACAAFEKYLSGKGICSCPATLGD